MSIFCKIYGHTWTPATRGGNPRWNTTKAGNVLEATAIDDGIRYLDLCCRCGVEREASVRRDYDAPAGPDATETS